MQAESGRRAASAPVQTARLLLTPVGLAEVDDLVRLYRDPQVAFWTGPWTDSAVQAWAAEMAVR